jgi:GAF domain-containing protein
MKLWDIIRRRDADKKTLRVEESGQDFQNKLDLRTHELAEALEQQRATDEVLRVISSSPTAVQPVLDAVVASAARLCEALNATIYLRDGDVVMPRAHSGPLGGMPVGQRLPLNLDWVTGRAVLEARTIHVPDLLNSDEYPQGKQMALRHGHRATLAVPLLREGTAIGAILVRRQEARPFTDKQIELVSNFAKQIVIAIENTRLLNELRQRTDELSESLKQQTATSEVLSVISSSPGKLEPIFQAMLANAVRICGAKFGTLYLRDADAFSTVAIHNAPPAYVEARTRELLRPPPDAPMGRVAATKQVVHIADIKAIPSYVERNPFVVTSVELGGYRTVLAVPMLKDNELIGAITINRQEVRLFTDKQIELVTNFAAQAVIAIENTRLLNELRQRTADLGESLEQQTATSEVLQVISSSPGELEPVFQAMLESATRICGAKFGVLWQTEGQGYRSVAIHGMLPAYTSAREQEPVIYPGPEVPLARPRSNKASAASRGYSQR